MPNLTITDLVSGSSATGAVLPADQAGSTVKVTPAQIVEAGGALPKIAVVTDITASQSLAAVPSGTILRVTSGTVVLTVPTRAVGTQMSVVRDGATSVDFTGSGVTLVFDQTTFDPTLSADGSSATLVWITTTRVMLAGDLELA